MRARKTGHAIIVAAALAVAVAHGADRGPALGARTLVVGTRVEPKTLNPIAITVSEGHDIAGLVFLKLLEEQGDFLTFKPQLAESWSVSPDGLDIRFVLRADARWSDGRPVTANDVRFTYEIQTDTTVAWPNASIKSRIRGVEAVDARTVVFHFRERYLYQLMDANDGVILPEHVLGRVTRAEVRTSAFGRAPVGNGPYRLSKWSSGQYVELEPNPEYFGGRPRVERLIFKFVPDDVTLVSQLRAGEIDLLESVQAGDLETIRRSRPGVELYAIPSRRINFVAWNLARAPLDDRSVRRAVTMAIDRREIVATVWRGYAQECTSPIVPLLWAHDPSIEAIPYDPPGARAALLAHGFEDHDGDGILDRDGQALRLELVVNDAQNRVDVATLIQAQLARIGVGVDLRVMEYGAFTERVLATDFDAALVEWKMSTKPDLTGLFHSRSMRPKGFNFVSYSNPEVDRLIDEALAMTDVTAAREAWSRAQRLIYEDQPYTFIAVPQELTAVDGRFCNVEPNAIGFFVNLHRWGVAADCQR